jgi:hypothetical protein
MTVPVFTASVVRGGHPIDLCLCRLKFELQNDLTRRLSQEGVNEEKQNNLIELSILTVDGPLAAQWLPPIVLPDRLNDRKLTCAHALIAPDCRATANERVSSDAKIGVPMKAMTAPNRTPSCGGPHCKLLDD